MNILGSTEHDCSRTATPSFGGLDSAHTSLQIAPLDSAHVQETQLVRKKRLQVKYIYKQQEIN
jgi:hypothetical protein